MSGKRKACFASRAITFNFFTTYFSWIYTLPDTPRERGGKHEEGRDRGELAAWKAAARGWYPWVYLRFAWRLSIQAFRKGREAIEQRRLIAAKLGAEPPRRATITLLSTPPSLHLAPGLGATIRKGVNRNGSIYTRARGSDIPSNRWCVKSFGDLAEELIYSLPSTISFLIPYDWNFCAKDLIVLFFLFCSDVQMLNFFVIRRREGSLGRREGVSLLRFHFVYFFTKYIFL